MKNNQPHLPASSAWFWAIPSFALISMLIIGVSGSNSAVFLFINDILYIQPDHIWLNITLYGDGAMVMIMLLPLIAKRSNIITKAFFAAIFTSLFTHSLKNYFALPRPPAVFSADLFHPIGNQFTVLSFPSGHSAAVFALATIIIFFVTDVRVRSFVVFAASLIALSRVAVGVHWPMDILAGMFFGWLGAYISIRFIPTTGENLIAQRILALLLILAAVHLIFLHHSGDDEARFLEILTPVICLILSLKGLKSLFLDPILLRVKE
jgi:membrane-associated phospholipid phosphatase